MVPSRGGGREHTPSSPRMEIFFSATPPILKLLQTLCWLSKTRVQNIPRRSCKRMGSVCHLNPVCYPGAWEDEIHGCCHGKLATPAGEWQKWNTMLQGRGVACATLNQKTTGNSWEWVIVTSARRKIKQHNLIRWWDTFMGGETVLFDFCGPWKQKDGARVLG